MLRLSARFLTQIGALALALVVIATAADAAQRRAKPEAPPPPPQFKVEGPTRSLAMERIGLTVPASTVIGEFIVHTFCVTNAYPILMSDAIKDAATANFIDVFMQEAAAAGYQLGGQQSSADLFSSGDQKKPELIVGAAIVGAKQNGCGQNIFGMINITMDTSITIDWQVFDPLEKKLVYRVTKEGATKLKQQLAAETIPTQAALAAFRESAKALLSDANFVAAVAVPGAAAGPAGAAAPAPQPQAAPSVEIPRVALRTAAFREQIPELRHQVVTILTGDGSGSGFYVADGLIMTNHHVIEGHKRVKIRFFGGREIPGEVVTSDARRDVALVLAPGGGMMGLPLQFERPQVGAPVYVIGSPLGKAQEGSVSGGIVSAYRNREGKPVLQSDVAINAGNSGGPMFDDKGNVVAIVVSGFGEMDSGVNFFIPVDDAFRVIGLGVKGVDLTPPQAAQLASAGGRSIQVSMYPAGGPLQKSGKTQPITGNVGGVGTTGTFTFTRPDGVNCDGRWTTLQSKPAVGSLLDKHRDVVGIAANPEGMVGGLALGACSNGGSFQAEYYVVPNIDSGFGAATDSDGNIYKVIF